MNKIEAAQIILGWNESKIIDIHRRVCPPLYVIWDEWIPSAIEELYPKHCWFFVHSELLNCIFFIGAEHVNDCRLPWKS